MEGEANPLFAALQNREPLGVIRSIVERTPALLRERNEIGDLPLHYAIQNSLPPGSVRYLLDEWPESVRVRTAEETKSELPIHLACWIDDNALTLEYLPFLVAAWPQSLQEKNYLGDLPLHNILKGVPFPPLDTVRSLVDAYPDALQVVGHCGYLPLHIAMCEQDEPDIPVIRYLVERCPKAVRLKTRELGFALVVAIRSSMPLPVIRDLVHQWPGSLREMAMGKSPLHWAASEGAFDAARFLLRKWPESIQARSDDWRLPLHWAAQRGDLELVRLLLRKLPLSIQVISIEGRLPLHEEAREGMSNVVEYLVRKWRDSGTP